MAVRAQWAFGPASRRRNAETNRLRFEPLEDRRVLSASASEAINQFGYDLYEHMQREQGNLFFSPLSLSTGLAMTSVGAAGQTLSEMQQVLHLGTDPSIYSSYNDLIVSALSRTIGDDDFDFIVSNAIWPQEGLSVKQDFVNTIGANFGGHVQGLDYANPQEAEDTINAWVSDRTNGKIDDLVSDLDPLTLMVLTNTVYFNSLWDIPFDTDNTASRTFYVDPSESTDVTMMYGQPDAYRTQIDGFDVLELTMADGDASAVYILPLTLFGPDVVSNETLARVEAWRDGPRQLQQFVVEVPRFETTVESNLNQFLVDLGMPTAFSEAEADFSSMLDVNGAFISEVSHKATIEVTERGVQATGATDVEILLCFAAGTPVLTPEGSKPIEQLRAGDVVLARDEHNIEGDLEPKVIEETRQGTSPVLEVTIKDQTLRVTDLHPFFVRGRGWTPAGKLQQGDLLASDRFDWVEVERVVETAKAVPVFNLRVADHHTYFVGEQAWGFAVWTHNFYDDRFVADHPFHLLIHDNVTDTIAFMGRISNPTQTENSVTPAYEVAVIPGDYDADGDVDSDDYDVWRAAYGQIGAGLAADGNGDGVVDAADYTIWRDHEGASTAIAPAETADAVASTDGEAVSETLGAEFLTVSSPTRPAARSGRPTLRIAFSDAEETDLLLLARAVASRPPLTQPEAFDADPGLSEAGSDQADPLSETSLRPLRRGPFVSVRQAR